MVENKWFQHFHALLVSTFQLMGCILYLGCEWHWGFPHLPAPVSKLSMRERLEKKSSVPVQFCLHCKATYIIFILSDFRSIYVACMLMFHRKAYRVCIIPTMYSYVQDWPWPTFNSYLKLKYFWLIFVGCNGVWIVVPLLVYWHTFSEMASLLQDKTSKSKTQ